MSIQLYKHNQITYDNMCLLFQQNQRVAVVQPTGTGKSFLYLKWMEDHPEQKILVVSPSHYIFQQLEVYQAQANTTMEHNTAPEQDTVMEHNTVPEQVSYMTYARLAKLTTEELQELKPDFLVLDEFHRCGAPEWGRGVSSIMEMYPKMQVLGTSATPIRYLDSCRDMAQEVFQETYAVNMSIAEAMAEKILPIPIYVASYYSFLGELENLQDRVKQTNNEQLKLQLYNKIKKAKRMLIEKECSIQEIFQKHMTNPCGRYIVFCSNEERLNEAMDNSDEWFAGRIDAIHKYKVLSTYRDSKAEFEAFATDSDTQAVKLLFCVDMLNEGIHVEDVEGVIMLRTTESLNVYYQQLGRALTCVGNSDGNSSNDGDGSNDGNSRKRPVIFDLVNNFENGDAGSIGIELMSQLYNGENDIAQDIDFQVYDYILDLRKVLDDIRNTFERNWDYNYESVKSFIEEQGRFPYNREIYHGIDLGSWCIVQRRQREKGVLARERVELLEQIAFQWDPREASWQGRYEALAGFLQAHGRLPKRRDDASLYSWMVKQKQMYRAGQLEDKRAMHLREIGVELEVQTSEQMWNARYDLITRFVEVHKRLPQSDETYEGMQLGTWLVEQRSQERGGRLSQERQEKLEAQGVVFKERKDRAFWNNIQLLRGYVAERGHFPNTADKYQGFGIGMWCARVRDDYKKNILNIEQIEALQEMKFDLRSNQEIQQEQRWQQYYNGVEAFVVEHGRLPKGRENQNLYWWLKKQRQVMESGKMSKVQMERLQKIMTV